MKVNKQIQEEYSFRRTGRTTRIIDSLIQEIFLTGSCIVRDHKGNLQIYMKQHKDRILKRLEIEHGLTDLDVETILLKDDNGFGYMSYKITLNNIKQ